MVSVNRLDGCKSLHDVIDSYHCISMERVKSTPYTSNAKPQTSRPKFDTDIDRMEANGIITPQRAVILRKTTSGDYSRQELGMTRDAFAEAFGWNQ
jgi:hypothetical protein